MSKVFYDHLILIEELFIVIDELPWSSEEKQTAKQLIDETLHHQIVTHILDLLPEDDHDDFLGQLHRAPYDPKILKYLEEKINADIHREIATLGKKLKHEILKDIQKTTKKK